MQAKENTQYAVIQNGKVTQIFSGNDIREWDETSIHAVEIPDGKEVEIGTQYDTLKNVFAERSLDDEKASLLEKINFFFERELFFIKGIVTDGESQSWSDQLREAKLLKSGSTEATPLLTQLASKREMDINILADKIIEKNNAYLEKLGILLGHRQNLEKQVESAKTKKSLQKIVYVSPFNEN